MRTVKILKNHVKILRNSRTLLKDLLQTIGVQMIVQIFLGTCGIIILNLCLTLSQTSPGFYVSAEQVF